MTSICFYELRKIIEILVRGWQPDELYLFGSQARGEADESSDVDLLLVVPDSDLPRHRREALSYDLLWGLTTPVDVIVLTQAEFQRGKKVKTSLPSTIQDEGKLLYERS
jgi:predicted nucleotidyltransferase